MIIVKLPSGWARGQFIGSQEPGRDRVQMENGRILSIDGDKDEIVFNADASADGAWEQCRRLADVIAFVFDWNGRSITQVFPYRVI